MVLQVRILPLDRIKTEVVDRLEGILTASPRAVLGLTTGTVSECFVVLQTRCTALYLGFTSVICAHYESNIAI